MASSSATIRHSFTVESVQSIFSPNPKEVWQQFDEHGLALSEPRLKSETNWEYRRRLKDVFSHRANAAYNGLVYGITRELGLSLFDALSINPKMDTNHNLLATDPAIIFDGAFLYLYTDYQNGSIELEINRYKKGGNYETLGRLIELVNSTDYFEAKIGTGIDEYTSSMTILNQSNIAIVDEESIQSSNRFALKNKFLCQNTVFFNDRNVFYQEQSSEAAVKKDGDYYIDYRNGIVRVYNTPILGTAARYSYIKYPFVTKASPVILHNINNINFTTEIFDQILQENGTYINGLPTDIGVDIILELLSVKPMYWGV